MKAKHKIISYKNSNKSLSSHVDYTRQDINDVFTLIEELITSENPQEHIQKSKIKTTLSGLKESQIISHLPLRIHNLAKRHTEKIALLLKIIFENTEETFHDVLTECLISKVKNEQDNSKAAYKIMLILITDPTKTTDTKQINILKIYMEKNITEHKK